MASINYSAEYSYKNTATSGGGTTSGVDIDSGAFDASDRIESAFGGASSSSTFNVPDFSSSTPEASTTYEEIDTVGPNGEIIRGYKKTFSSSTTSTKTRSFGGSAAGSSGSLKLQSEGLRESISPIPARSSSSMSKLNQEVHEHSHSSSCTGHDHSGHSHSTHIKRPASGSGEAKLAYTYKREEKRESRSSTTPRESSRKNVKWSDHHSSNKENIIDLKDIDFLPDPDLDKDISLHTMEKTTTRTQRRYKDESEKFSYGDFAMIPPSAARSPLPARKTQVRDRSPSPTIDPRSPSPVHQVTIPPKFMETRTPSPHAKCGADLEKEHNCKYHSHHLDYKYTPPPVKGPCVACGQYIVGSLVTALDEMWHPECFTCVNCDCILKAHNYVVEDGKQYCKDCHLRLFGPPCSVCHKPTQSNRYNLLNRIWHPECFCCVECGKRLTPDNFIERLGSPYCKEDYHRLFSPKCCVCHLPITDKAINALNKMWHPHCFKCTHCGIPLEERNFYEKNGLPYCEKDYMDLFHPKCWGCKKPIADGRQIIAMGKPWHPECFRCTVCVKPLSPDNFKEHDGKPYCEKDYNNLFAPKCAGCKGPIVDTPPVYNKGKPWHPECDAAFNRPPPPVFEPEIDIESLLKPLEAAPPKPRGPPCYACKQPIDDRCPITYNSATYHYRCFACSYCALPLGTLSRAHFRFYYGQLYCVEDFDRLFAPSCAHCHRPISLQVESFERWRMETLYAEHQADFGGSREQSLFYKKCLKRRILRDSSLRRRQRTKIEPIYDFLSLDLRVHDDYITAMGRNYHPNCFTCTECAKPLNPYNFYEKNGKPYCEDDYHRLFSPKCAGCKEPIKDNDYITAMGKDWHPNCFTCTECVKPLNPYNFYEKNGKPYCEDDYHKLFSPKCAGCKEPIKDNNYIRAMGKDWHPNCFKCDKCKIPLDPENFYEKNGKPYCEDDYHKLFSPKCHGCTKPIKGTPLRAMGKDWHPECFNCTACHIPLSPDNFYEKNGKPYCEKDYHKLFSPKCYGCTKPIKGRVLHAMGKDWHPECFNCAKCHIPLSPDAFMEKNGKPYCLDDYHKLFSPKCCACNLPIKEKPVFALGKEWHPRCFVCSHPRCDRILDPNNFETHDGKPYCKDHFNEMFLPKCFACKKPITDKVVSALGKTWHPECFACVQCNQPLDLNSFREKDGLPYCEADYHALFSPKCAACEAPIIEKCLTALGKTWHPEHFTCQHCNKIMADDPEGYHEHDGYGYCRPCYIELFAPYCRGCNKPIVDKICVTALNSKYHTDCFVCRDCSCPLKDGNYFEFEGEPYCEEHYRCKMCPDCVKLRRAQNKYFGTLNGHATGASTGGSGQKVTFNTGSLQHAHHHQHGGSQKQNQQQQHPFSIRLGA